MKKVNLGCGYKKLEGYINVDISEHSNADLIHDCEKDLPFEDNSIDEFLAINFLEHIDRDKIIHLFNEIWRTLKHNGVLVFRVPDAQRGQGAFQDLTHKTFFVKNTFKYFSNTYYHKLYGIRAKFLIEELEEVEYHDDYWGTNYAIMGKLKAVKEVITVLPAVKPTIIPTIKSDKIFCVDDVHEKYLENWKYFDKIKEKKPDFKVMAFVITEGLNHKKFNEWYEPRKDYIEIQPHCYDHERPQLGWRPYEEQKKDIKRSLKELKSYLPERIIYRFPGFRTMPYSERILRECGISGIAHQSCIKYFDTGKEIKVINTHLGDGLKDSISVVWEQILQSI